MDWASANGVATGYGDGLFGPEDPISREQMAVMLYNYARYLGLDAVAAGSLQGYADAKDVSGYAQEALLWATSRGFIQGDTGRNLTPQGIATRAEAAAIVHRMKENMMAEAE